MIKKILNSLQNLIFSTIGNHIKPGSFKRTMDIAFVLFEKIAFAFEDASKFYINVYQEMVDNELRLLKKYQLQKILVVGSGSIPATPILIAKKSNAHVVCIDIDTHAIKKSETLIKRMQLNNKITVKSGDGIHFPFEEFDAIFILYGMKSQKEIIDSLSQFLPEHIPVILRVVPQNDNALIDNTSFDLSSLFTVKNKVRSRSWGLLDSYLLERK
jgi:histidine 2-aminobutanoyltransferase